MVKEFNLSEKARLLHRKRYYLEQYVKEFIKLLKERIAGNVSYSVSDISKQGVIEWIDKLCGEKLR